MARFRIFGCRPSSWAAMLLGAVSLSAMAAEPLGAAGAVTGVAEVGALGVGGVGLYVLQRLFRLLDRWTSLSEQIVEDIRSGRLRMPDLKLVVDHRHQGAVGIGDQVHAGPGVAS